MLHPETGFTFPRSSDIARLTLIEVHVPQASTRQSSDVPKKCWEEILTSLHPSERDDDAGVMNIVGHVKIERFNDEKIIVFLYGWGNNLWFSVGDNPSRSPYFHGGSLARLERALAAAYEQSRKEKAAERRRKPIRADRLTPPSVPPEDSTRQVYLNALFTEN